MKGVPFLVMKCHLYEVNYIVAVTASFPIKQCPAVDQSLQSVADQYVASKSDPLTLYKRNLLKLFMDNIIGHESAGSLDNLSLW